MNAKESLLISYQDFLLLENGLSDLTISSYLSDIKRFDEFLQKKDIDLESFTSENVREYLEKAYEDEVEDRSTLRYLCSLRSFSKFLIIDKRREDNPLLYIENPKITFKLPIDMSEQTVDAMLSAPDIDKHVGLRDKAMFETLYATGLRVSELVNLKFESLNLIDGFILIKGKGDKERIIPLGENAIYWVSTYVHTLRAAKDPNKTSPYVFLSAKGIKAMTRIAFWYRVKVYARQIGLKQEPSPHTFRHAFATHLLNHDADLRTVQMLLGHSSLTTTQIYTHVANAHMHDTYDKAHPRA